MSYQVDRFSSNNFDTGWPVLISDNAVNNTFGVNLLGRGVTNYGELVAENFVYLLENFAGENPPANGVTGQLWYEANPATPGSGTLKVFNGTSWVTVGGAVTGGTLPVTASDGDLFYRINPGKNQLFGFNNGSWNRVAGLASSPGAPTPVNDGDFWLDLSIPQNVTPAPNNKQRILKVQISGAWYPISLGDPTGGPANNTSTSTNENLIVFSSDSNVLGAWSNTVRTAPAALASVFPNGLQIGLNLSNFGGNKIISPATGSSLTLGNNVAVQNNLVVSANTTTATLTVSGASTLNSLTVTGNSTLNGTLATTGNATFNSNVSLPTGFVAMSLAPAVAAAGAAQSTATGLNRQINFVNSGGANTGVRLPTLAEMPVASIIVINNITANTIRVWPSSGASINGASVNTSIDLGANGSVMLIRRSENDFRSIDSIYG